MLRAQLAEKIISAGSEIERKRVLTENGRQADIKLACALKDICYAAWTTEPVKAQKASQALKTLARVNPHEEISALSFWVAGIAELTRGRLASAVKNLDRAAEIFFQIGKEHDVAQTQVAKLIPLAMLGRYDEAFQTGKKALKIFKKYGDELGSGKVEMNLGNIGTRHELHQKAKKLFSSAHKRFLALNETLWLTMCENNLAITYSALNDFRNAEKFYAQALNRARAAKMSVTEAEIEASMGNLALFRGKLDRALKFLELSRRKYEALKMPHQTRDRRAGNRRHLSGIESDRRSLCHLRKNHRRAASPENAGRRSQSARQLRARRRFAERNGNGAQGTEKIGAAVCAGRK